MAAANTDKLKKVASNTGWQVGGGGVADAVVTIIPGVSLTGLPTDTALLVTVDRVDSSGTKTPSKMERFIGVVSGNNFVSCIRGVEGLAQPQAGGAVIECVIAPKYWNDIVDWGLVEHNQDGTHKLVSGWTSIFDTWAYSSASSITVPSGAAGKYQIGDKIMWTQTSIKYGVIKSVSDTLITIIPNTDYVVTNATISAISHSRFSSPLGFPKMFNFTPNPQGLSSIVQNIGTYSVSGRLIHCYIDAGGVSNNALFYITPPTTPSGYKLSGWTVSPASTVPPLLEALVNDYKVHFDGNASTWPTTGNKRVILDFIDNF